jgi:putative membrane protein
LGKQSGTEFDRAYMKHMLDDHQKDVSDFEKAAKSAKDADVKTFAARTLPTLQAHLQLAQKTYDAVK